MRKYLLLLLAFLPGFSNAQISRDIAPKSRDLGLSGYVGGRTDVQTFEITNINNTNEQQQAEQECPDCRMNYFGKNVPVNIDVKNSAQKIQIPGGTIYVLRIRSATAKSLMLRFSRFVIPPYATMHLYSRTSDFLLGAFTSDNVNPDGRFFTGIFPEEAMVLEYYEPDVPNFAGEIMIDGLVHGFRSVTPGGDYGTSGTCTVDAVCKDPNLTDFDLVKESKAIAYIIGINNGRAVQGTGFLINSTTTGEYKKPYILTANHVVPSSFDSPTPYAPDVIFYFGYENKECGVNEPFPPTMSPRTYKFQGASYKAVGSPTQTNGECEYTLLEMNDNPARWLQVSYLGWDARAAIGGQPFYNLSFPGGDVKKKARSTKSPTQTTWYFGGNTATAPIPVYSVEWSKGVTQPGSSGSPLLNTAKRVVGILSAGRSRCADSPEEEGLSTDYKNGPDLFSKMALAYNKSLFDYQPMSAFLNDAGLPGTMYLDTEESPDLATTPPPTENPPPTHACLNNPVTDEYALKITFPSDLPREFGRSVSVQDNYLIAGAPGEKAAYIYEKTGCDFTRKARLVGFDNVGRFGYSVDIYGNLAVVGDPGDDISSFGYVYIFERVNGNWLFAQRLTTSSNGYGNVVSVWENNLIVGSPKEQGAAGRVYMYKRNTSTGLWSQYGPEMKGFIDTNTNTYYKIGTTVDIKSTRAVVGIPDRNEIRICDITGSSPLYFENIKQQDKRWGRYVVLSDDEQELFSTMVGTLSYFKRDGASYSLLGSIFIGGDIANLSNVPGKYLAVTSSKAADYFQLLGRGNDGHWQHLSDVPAGPTNRSFMAFMRLSLSKNDFIAAGDFEYLTPCFLPGSVYVYDITLARYGNAGDVKICDVTPSKPRENIYANTLEFGGDCTAVFEPGTETYYGAYHSARLKPGFFAKTGSIVSVLAMDVSCMGWPGTAVSRVPSTAQMAAEPIEELPVERPSEGVSVYPNPSTGSFRVVSHQGKILQVQLYDTQGIESNSHTIVPIAADTYEINCGPFLKGLCVLRIRTENTISTTKVILR
jgi:hypothetical protein